MTTDNAERSVLLIGKSQLVRLPHSASAATHASEIARREPASPTGPMYG